MSSHFKDPKIQSMLQQKVFYPSKHTPNLKNQGADFEIGEILKKFILKTSQPVAKDSKRQEQLNLGPPARGGTMIRGVGKDPFLLSFSCLMIE